MRPLVAFALSSDGRQLAVIRRYGPDGQPIGGANTPNATDVIQIVPASGGPPREIFKGAKLGTTMAWAPDGRSCTSGRCRGQRVASARPLAARRRSCRSRWKGSRRSASTRTAVSWPSAAGRGCKRCWRWGLSPFPDTHAGGVRRRRIRGSNRGCGAAGGPPVSRYRRRPNTFSSTTATTAITRSVATIEAADEALDTSKARLQRCRETRHRSVFAGGLRDDHWHSVTLQSAPDVVGSRWSPLPAWTTSARAAPGWWSPRAQSRGSARRR